MMSNAFPTLTMTYIGGPTLLIEFDGLRLLTDPTFDDAGSEYTTGPVTLSKTKGPALNPDALGMIDAVLLSHDHHFDNLDRTGREVTKQAREVLTTVEGALRLGGNSLGLANWDHYDIAAPNGRILRITGTPARHGPPDGDRGPVTGFIVHFLDDPQNMVYISGDTVWYEGVIETFCRFPAIRVAVLFLGAAHVPVVRSHLTFSAAEAIRFAHAMPRTQIVPMHFEGWKHFSESREQISGAFAAAGLRHRLHWLPTGVACELSLHDYQFSGNGYAAHPQTTNLRKRAIG
jgi:L-ascorbate metabolism protein UlaG (beta-lactamase superfamily)